ncbi:hypothetical protein D5F01_LYC00943 [Larimichthys crocea]|uniref:Uncharacterized protein n=1 Tax=Larimichthys crocea TaxID=215358 RepID=A0A6G0JBF4_LARCR|nr:hypothetical protein D5F01_LYC00943 [Larimichthys crocea]
MAALKDELSLYRSDVEKMISAGLHRPVSCTTTSPTPSQEVAVPTCEGFALTWQNFLEMCDDIIELGSKSTSVTDIKKEAVHLCAVMFRTLVSRCPCSSFDSSQLTAILCSVKERVVKGLSRSYEMVNSEQALFIHHPTISPSILRDNLTSYIQAVMRHSLAAAVHASPRQSQKPPQLQL